MSRRLTEKDIPSGSRFWDVVTVSPPYQKGGVGQSYIDLRCEHEGCGRLFTTRTNYLLSGDVKSCGCYRSRTGKNHPLWKGTDGAAGKVAWLRAEKDNPCFDCGGRFPYFVMQFDHVPERGPKLFEVSQNAAHSRRTPSELKAERAKCDLVCANCHAIRTWTRKTQGNNSHDVTEREVA